MKRVLAHVERVGARLRRRKKWIVLPRMTRTTPMALARWDRKYQGPFTSKLFAQHVAADATAVTLREGIVWEALPLAEFDPSDAPLSPYVDHIPGGVG